MVLVTAVIGIAHSTHSGPSLLLYSSHLGPAPDTVQILYYTYTTIAVEYK